MTRWYAKFRKGAQVEANLGALARNQLELNDKRARGEVNLPLFMKKITTGMSSQIVEVK
jgi:hypothetical protein